MAVAKSWNEDKWLKVWNENMQAGHENSLAWTNGQETAEVFLSQKRLITKVRKLAESDKNIEIHHTNGDGSILALMPVSYIHISPPRKLNFTEETRQALSERMKDIRAQKEERRYLNG